MIYYLDERESCPGCIINNLKQSNSGIPFKHFFYVFLLALITALPMSSLFPFLYFMIKDFNIAKREEDIGYYVGVVGSAFMFGRFLTSIIWGMIADEYGRKPVMIFGTIAVIIFNTLFGLSTNFWMAVSTRFLLGSLCGILGPMRAYVSEICHTKYEALGMCITSTAWGIGLVIGPTLGGFLSQETLHFHTKNGYDQIENLEELEEISPSPKQSLFKNWPLMSSIIVFSVFQLHDMAYAEIFPLWAVSSKNHGGLSYSSEEVGEVLAISGFVMLLFQLFLYPTIERTFGPVLLSRVGAVIIIVVLSCYPFIAKFSGLKLTILIDLASVLHIVISACITTGMLLLQNRAVSQSQRGAANGISMTVMSLFKAAGPAGGGALFSWAQNHQNESFLSGDQMVFFILNAIEFIALIMTFKPFLAFSDVN
ncbi:protein ZINC INDUCED FACILITATOR-LIKE 1-like isoform X3 [Cannabis sativa]|uniref:protein ZINC INDUCED FACILITATOR-LIKE 1-like isoform X3 n=1 Tax=Cannabis sativa TaxID=3483 RepID=UPI0029CA8F17|nr:protein ZINC INDUCED FACILITATOR-LIKE 1-like isoform X3 [Cannabis sativa]